MSFSNNLNFTCRFIFDIGYISKFNFFIMRILIFFALVVLLACQDQDYTAELNKLSVEDDKKFKRELSTLRNDILNTAELNILLRENGYTYNGELVNDPSRSSAYFNSKEQALNIGVYATDLNYMSVFDQSNETLDYVISLFDLAEELSITEAFNKSTLMDVLNDSQTDYKLKSDELTEFFKKAEDEINTSDRAQITALIIAGGWVEGMYISTSIARENWPNDTVAVEMWNQCFSYHKVMNMLEIFKDYPPCDEVYQKFVEVEPAVSEITNGSVITLKNNLEGYQKSIAELRSYVVGI